MGDLLSDFIREKKNTFSFLFFFFFFFLLRLKSESVKLYQSHSIGSGTTSMTRRAHPKCQYVTRRGVLTMHSSMKGWGENVLVWYNLTPAACLRKNEHERLSTSSLSDLQVSNFLRATCLVQVFLLLTCRQSTSTHEGLVMFEVSWNDWYPSNFPLVFNATFVLFFFFFFAPLLYLSSTLIPAPPIPQCGTLRQVLRALTPYWPLLADGKC